jgi:hypothetical protein
VIGNGFDGPRDLDEDLQVDCFGTGARGRTVLLGDATAVSAGKQFVEQTG